ncbi:hypothetical protein FRC09_011067 [Ceratobasidium sp. 395]|nr:hypothetical protein FRC09_011067 [Ceratobasidium sp. 395]
MYSFCEYLEGSGRLSASFFCSRKHPSCRDVSRMVSSISYQLATQSRPYRCVLSRVLSQDPEVVKRSINEQVERLILVPLQTVAHTVHADPVIVIDGLDQCEDTESAKSALDVILRLASDLPVRFLVASCPSPGIRGRIRKLQAKHNIPLELRLDEQDQTVVQGDIRGYLAVKLESLALTVDDLEQLLRRVGVLFFYAQIVVDYLTDSAGAPNNTTRLNDLLDISSSSDGIQTKETLDTFMLEKLLEAARPATTESEEMKLVISTLVSAQERLSVNAIGGLLCLDLVHVVGDLLHWLLPVLRVSPTDSRAIFVDESFTQYLSNSSSISELLLDQGELNERLTHACFKVICSVDPPFNICNLQSSYLQDREVSDLSERVEEAIPSDVQDAMKDAGQFVESFSSGIITGSTPHIYLSQLQFWPQHKRTYQCYRHRLGEFVNQTHADGHTDQIRSVCNSPDGAYIASGSYDNTIRIWDAHTGKPIGQPLAGHTGRVNSVTYSPDGACIASGSDDQTIWIWDARTGKPVSQPLAGHTGRVNSVTYSPDGACVASGSDDQTIWIWDAHTGEPVGQPLTGHTREVNSVAYSPNGAYIASGSWDSTIRIWDARTGKPVGQPFRGYAYAVWSVAYSPDGAYIASGSLDKTIRIWDARNGKPVSQPLTGHTDRVYSVAYSPDGAYIVSGSMDHTIRIWDTQTGKPVGQPLIGHTDVVYSVAYSPDGTYILSGSQDNAIRIWFAPPPPEPELVQLFTPLQRTTTEPFRRPFWTVLKSTNRTSHSPRPKRIIKETDIMLKQQAAVIPPITASPYDWMLNEDGWVVGPSQERLVWVPPDLRGKVAPSRTKAIISSKPSVFFDFRQAKLGLDWPDCYNPSS